VYVHVDLPDEEPRRRHETAIRNHDPCLSREVVAAIEPLADAVMFEAARLACGSCDSASAC
jgi:hypothetical protein